MPSRRRRSETGRCARATCRRAPGSARGPRGLQGPAGPAGPPGGGGAAPEAWKSVSLAAGWANFGGGFEGAGCRKDNGQALWVRGTVNEKDYASLDTVSFAPA